MSMKRRLKADCNEIADSDAEKITEKESSSSDALAGDLPPDEKPPITTRIKGIGLMVITCIFATTAGSIVKYVKDLPTGMISLITAIYTVCFLSVVVTHMGVSLTKFPMKKWVALRIAFGSVSQVCQVWSFQYLPLGDASALVYTSPLFTSALARIFLKEEFTPVTILSLLSGLGGVILVVKPSFIFKTEGHEFPWYYTLVPLLAAFCLGVFYVLQRRLAAHVNSITIAFYQAVALIFAGIAWQVVSGDDYTVPLCYLPRVLLVACALSFLMILVTMNLALKFEGAASASIVRNLDTVLAFFVQVFMFGVPAEALSLAGASLIMGGTIILALSKMFNINCSIKF